MPDSSDKLDPFDADETVLFPKDDRTVDEVASDSGNLPTIDSGHVPNDQLAFECPDLVGYQIVEELGRGGMGVVYKAQDRKLNRSVALKMILGGRFASDDDIARFKLEAEAAARLDHSGIVPIYEVGEAEGNHFFSMKFIDGKSLAEQGEYFRDHQRRAIEMLLKVAHAVQHAHARGVLHRDLKPANILIDEQGDPHVTDFGLAKQIDNDSDMTRTGLAMGTPGYMAPEQAAGRRDITTAADVFSLGAILYWLQTGTAPFEGDSPMQKLVATLESEIPSIRSVVAKADSGLDLICKKAMARDPEERYSSVAGFAADLQAWLDGEPLSVRPPGALNLATLWIRKNMRTLLGAIVCGAVCGSINGVLPNLRFWRELIYDDQRLETLDGTRSWISNFSWLRDIDSGLVDFLPVGAPFVIAICVILNVLWCRPKTREANVFSAAATGLTALGFALLVGIGWAPIAGHSVEKGMHDIKFLSSTLWMESEEERDLARFVLEQRYPGLANVSRAKKEQWIALKIKLDQVRGILPGLWHTVFGALVVVALPIAISCALTGRLWQAGTGRIRWCLLTLEHAWYCVFGFSTLGLLLSEVAPRWYYVWPSLLLTAIALYIAVQRCRWHWRVCMFVLAMFSVGAARTDVNSMWSASYRARLALSDQELRPQVEYMEQFLAQKEDNLARYRVAVAWLYFGDEEKYRYHANYLYSHFEYGSDPGFAEQLSKIYLLRPDLHDPGHMPTIHRLAELASGFDSNYEMEWLYMTRGLCEQRKGNPRVALEWTKRARNANPESGHYMDACSHLIDALAHLDLASGDLAKASLVDGRALFDAIQAAVAEQGRDYGWVDRLIFLMLEQEFNARVDE